jgi:CheY-like chemotaxis protein
MKKAVLIIMMSNTLSIMSFVMGVTKKTQNASIEQVAEGIFGNSVPLKPLIMVVDDNPVNQKLTILQLDKHGYKVHALLNGKDAVEAYAQNPSAYSLILMDCYMPVMSGFLAASEIRRLELLSGNGHLPIIAITASQDPIDRDNSYAAGMDDFLSKPVRQQQLLSVIKRWLAE